ncbi:FAD-dependent oxidoreductase [Paenibacillus roseipurpureus]|uniref:FAD-dependent oxidoreductase n=1 Tax=Paenibacillus roseopurpureus TaxID=2918901 RepID=A0AA96RM15_9BACL|nr:FAD-dependent oxidoreductase [Paenibacillus sp. MBLB1832]WNR45996.1 FAD-dependent oxidoreductase [Paenibacillus sp. MBLB1832]
MNKSQFVNGVIQQFAYSKMIPTSYDVIVVGLGTAGSIAAISAARRGLRVLGIEQLACMGGTGTAGSVLGYYFGSRGGLAETLDTKVSEMEKRAYTPCPGVNGEVKKLVLEQAAIEAGVSLNYTCTVTGVLMDGSQVRGIEWMSPDGRQAALASVVIDATGNADVCRMAGCSFRGGREFDGQAQPYSNVVVKLVDGKVRNHYTDSGYVIPHNPESVSEAVVSSALLPTHLKDRYDDNERLLKIAPLLGIREGNFIVGEEQVTFKDFLDEKYAKKPVFFAYSNADNHSKDIAFESEIQQDWVVAASMWGFNFTVPVPLGALIPQGYEGLMVAGRSLAVDHDLASCIRMKRDMQKSGEVAGQAAYLAIKHKLSLKDVPYEELVELLMESGCLSKNDQVTFKEAYSWDDEQSRLVKWLMDSASIQAGLSGDRPGLAMWSAKRLGSKYRDALVQWSQEAAHPQLQRQSAMTLALMGDMSAAPVLRQIVLERDPYVPKTSRKYNQVRGYAAIFLLGKLGDLDSVPELIRIMEDPGELCLADNNREFILNETELRFQYISFALVALTRIGDKHEEARHQISVAFQKLANRLDGSLIITFKGSTEVTKAITFVMDAKIRSWIEQTQAKWGIPITSMHA